MLLSNPVVSVRCVFNAKLTFSVLRERLNVMDRCLSDLPGKNSVRGIDLLAYNLRSPLGISARPLRWCKKLVDLAWANGYYCSAPDLRDHAKNDFK